MRAGQDIVQRASQKAIETDVGTDNLNEITGLGGFTRVSPVTMRMIFEIQG